MSEPCLCLHAKAIASSPSILIISEKRGGSSRHLARGFPPLEVESANGLGAWKILQDSFPGQLSKGCAISSTYLHAVLFAAGLPPRLERSQIQLPLPCLLSLQCQTSPGSASRDS